MENLTDTQEDCIQRDVYAQMRNLVRTLEVFGLTEVMDVTYGALVSTLQDVNQMPETSYTARYGVEGDEDGE